MSETTIVLGLVLAYLIIFAIFRAVYELVACCEFWPVSVFQSFSRELKRLVMLWLGLPMPEQQTHPSVEGPCQ